MVTMLHFGTRADCWSRFIPNREGQDLQATYSLLHEDGCPSTPSKTKRRAPHGELHFQKSEFFLVIPNCMSCVELTLSQPKKRIGHTRESCEVSSLETLSHKPT